MSSVVSGNALAFLNSDVSGASTKSPTERSVHTPGERGSNSSRRGRTAPEFERVGQRAHGQLSAEAAGVVAHEAGEQAPEPVPTIQRRHREEQDAQVNLLCASEGSMHVTNNAKNAPARRSGTDRRSSTRCGVAIEHSNPREAAHPTTWSFAVISTKKPFASCRSAGSSKTRNERNRHTTFPPMLSEASGSLPSQ